MKNISITYKLTIAFILFAGLLLIGLSIPAYLKGRESLRSATISELVSTSLEKQSALNAWISDRQHTINGIAKHKYLGELISGFNDYTQIASDQNVKMEDILSILNDWSGEGHNFLNLQVIDVEDGQIIISTEPDDVGKFREDQPFFIEGKKTEYTQNPYFDLSLQQPIMTAAAPILSSEGKPIAVLAGQLNLNELNDIILRRSGLHQSDDVFLVNSAHFFITQPRLIPDPAVLIRGIYTEAVNICLNQTNGEIDTIDYRGIPAIIVYRWLPSQQLCLITKIDQQEAYAPTRSLGLAMINTGLVVLLIGSLSAILLSRSFTKPIYELADGTKQLTRGNLDHRIKVNTTDEIGRLGTAFNLMAETIADNDAKLRGWAEELEQKVAKRTADLFASESKFRDLSVRQEAILSAVPDILMEVDNNKIYRWANPAGIDFFGDEVIGKEADFYFEGEQNTYSTVKPLFAGKEEVIYLESWQRRKDGEKRLLAWHCKMLKDNDGMVTGALSSAIDITERKKTEQELRTSEEDFRAIFERSTIGKSITAPDGKLLKVNTAFPAMLGYTIEEFQGIDFSQITYPDDISFSKEVIRSLLANERDMIRFEKRYLHKDGSIIWADVSTRLLRDENGNPLYLMTSLIDINARKKAEEEILKLNENLEEIVKVRTSQLLESNKELESFSYSVSHDLRAPLRALDGFSLAILEDYSDKLDEDGKKYLNRIREASQKMAKLIDAMLILSRVTKTDLALTEVNLTDLAAEISSELTKHYPDRKVIWKIEPGMTVTADPVLIKNAMENLLGNALKFTSKHLSATIEVGSIHKNDEEIYFVRDDGAGFDMTYASKLFGAFQRMHSTAEFEGTGIGLATVNRIIIKHGGRIWAEGKQEIGATFYFTLN